MSRTNKKKKCIQKVNNSCSTSIFSVGCAKYILNNCIQNLTVVLLFDIELNIFFNILNIFTFILLRVGSVKDFCDSVKVEYKKSCLFQKQGF